jgi:DNA/RNA endonuclease YhcR with UshA esterase domain
MKPPILFAVVTVLTWPFAAAGACLGPEEANNHVGESACVCGFVASSHYAPNSKSQRTFLNLDKPYPNQRFTAVIFGDDRSKFGEPERTFQGKHVCVTGEIQLYRQKPEIIVHDPEQLKE